MIQTLNLFPTVIQVIDLSDLVAPCLKVVDHWPGMGQHDLIQGASSWGQSANFLDHEDLTQVRAQLDHLTCRFAVEQLDLPPVTISNSWFNLQSHGDQVLEHRHAMSVVSAAFYLDCLPGSSPLDFHDPVEPQRQFEYNMISRLRHSEPAVAGKLVLFPSWLGHSTRANGSDCRLVASWNSAYCYS